MTFDVSTISAVVMATVTISGILLTIRRDLRDLKKNSYTMAAACEHALRMKVANPGLRIPDPRHPDRLIGGGE